MKLRIAYVVVGFLALAVCAYAQTSGGSPSCGQIPVVPNALPPSGPVTGTGTPNYLPLWDSTSDITASVIFQLGSGSGARVGIGTAKPRSSLEVQGSTSIWGALSVTAPSLSGATAGNFVGSQAGGGDGIRALGGGSDLGVGGNGVVGIGGTVAGVAGAGGVFTGGYGGFGSSGNGVEAYGGSADFGGAGGVFTAGDGSTNGNDGIDAFSSGNTSNFATYGGNFSGDLNVTGTIYAGTKDFRIDHPLDPANKYLVHASVESSEMKNIYDGNVTTDAQGRAAVQLPEWFEALNTDFRYQLTVIGQFAQAIVAHEIENNRFDIRSSAPNVKVSWQVTGVRQDAYAKANPLVVEQEKETGLRGFYLHPELHGAPAEKQIEWARYPQLMKKIHETRARQRAEAVGEPQAIPASQ